MRSQMNRPTLSAVLLLSSALTAPIFASSAIAQTAPAETAAPAIKYGQSGGFGETMPTDIGRVSSGKAYPDGVNRTDIGGGLMIPEDEPKTRSTVTQDYIAKQAPTSNPYQLINALPGVNMQSTDANGLNGGNITIRGFQSNEIGLTIDGAPINDSGNFALYPQEYLDAQNIGQISVAQGYADLDSPHVGATGGVINIYSRDPSHTMGGFVSGSIGSHSTQNEFIRLETGDIGIARGYVSFSNYSDEHWRGPGTDQRTHIDAKAVADIGDASKITFSAIYNEELNHFYDTVSNANFSAYGVNAFQNNYDSVYNRGGTATKQVTSGAGGYQPYYGFSINPFKNLILTAPSTFALRDDVTLDVTPYFWYGYGNGGGATSVNAATGFNYGGYRIVQPLVGGATTGTYNYYSPSITETYRPGINSKITYQVDEINKIVAGYWFEDANQRQYGPFSALSAQGVPTNAYGISGSALTINGAPYPGQTEEKRQQKTVTMVNMVYLGDTATLLDGKLVIDGGFKQAWTYRYGTNLLPSGPNATITPSRTINDSEFLPTIGAVYHLDEVNQIFGGIGTTFKTPANYPLFDTVNATSTASNNGYAPGISEKDEKAIMFELGHRYQGELLYTSASAFYYQFTNRQLQTQIVDPAAPTTFISATINVGNTTTYGMDLEAGTRPINNFRPYISAEIQRPIIDSNIQTSGKLNGATIVDYVPSKGKIVPYSPMVMGFAGVDYDDGHLFGNFGAKWVGRQYGTFVNDSAAPSYFTLNAVIGYRFDDMFGFLKSPTIRLNLSNLTNTVALTGPATITNNQSTVTGVKGSTISGSTAYYYVNQGFAGMLTISAAF